jgi:multiple sugar transport system permease protein
MTAVSASERSTRVSGTRLSELSPKLSTAFTSIFLTMVVVYFLFPILWLVTAASKSTSALFGSTGFGFSGPFELFHNIARTFTYDGGVYGRWMLNSAIYAVGASLIGVTTAAMAGFALAKYDFPGRRLLFGFVLSGVLVPSTVLALPLYLEFSRVHLVNTYWAVLLPSVVNPFGVYICRIYAAQAIPDDLLDAARIDGCSEFRIFWTVGVKLMKPVLVTAFSFQVVAVWNNFLLPLIMDTSSHLFPLVLGVYEWNQVSQRGGAPPYIFNIILTGSLFAFLPLGIAFLFLQRSLRRGLAIGAIQ